MTDHWTSIDEERRLCNLWLNEPLINPETGHSISRNGPTFNSWKKRCKKLNLRACPRATKKMTWSKCQEWRKNPTINPDSGFKIKRGGETYKWIESQCKLIEKQGVVLEGTYFIPDTKGMVPCVKSRSTWYVLRKYNNRQVWGPLNKPAKNVKLVYYKDTWDYTYNHYRPIYISGKAPKRIGSPPQLPPQRRKKPKQPKSDPKYIVDNIVDLFIAKK